MLERDPASMPNLCRWRQRAADELGRLGGLSLRRRRSTVQPLDAVHVDIDGKTCVNFSSNNYLGLSHHPEMIAAVQQAAGRHGFGASAAPLITGFTSAHASAERAITQWKRVEAAILLPSGYQANLAAIQTAAAIGRLGGGARFLLDKLAHASLIDAVRATGEPFRIFPHNHMDKLQRLLAEAPPDQLQVVVTESIFSMDGDAADLLTLCKLKQEHDFLLILDEAHATGVYGPAGSGLAAELNVRECVDISIFTLSKALGGVGGAICGPQCFIDMMLNHGRAYLFSTAIPPAVAAAAETAVLILGHEPHRQDRVRTLARWVRQELASTALLIPPGDSPIIPVIVGSAEAAVEAAERLKQQGLLVLPVRPPTVPRGSSRLRVTLSSEHCTEEVEKLVAALKNLPAAIT